MQNHNHAARRSVTRTRPFTAPLQSARPNRAAHGGIELLETCRCGATRRTNINQRHHERGYWHELRDDDAR